MTLSSQSFCSFAGIRWLKTKLRHCVVSLSKTPILCSVPRSPHTTEKLLTGRLNINSTQTIHHLCSSQVKLSESQILKSFQQLSKCTRIAAMNIWQLTKSNNKNAYKANQQYYRTRHNLYIHPLQLCYNNISGGFVGYGEFTVYQQTGVYSTKFTEATCSTYKLGQFRKMD